MEREKIIAFVKPYLVPLVLGIIGIVCFSYGIFTTFIHPDNQVNLAVDANQEKAVAPSVVAKKQYVVDIEGAVVSPGVYHLPGDARYQDALKAAGGLSDAVDKNWIAQHVNLAAKLTDGGKIYIPHMHENVAGASAGNLGADPSQQVSINDASATELDSLPGIGSITALKIVNNRPYSDINDLVSKKIVNKKVFDEIKDRVSL